MVKIIKTVTLCAVAVIVLSGLSGCTAIGRNIGVHDVHYSVDSLHIVQAARFDSLMAEHAKLTAELRRLMEELNNNTETLRLLRADQVVRFGSLDNTVKAISDNVFDSQSKLRNLDRQTAEVKSRIDQQMAQSEDASAQREQNDFNIAKGDFDAGLFDMAMRGFRTFIKNFPNSARAIEAKYWIAESHYAKKDFDTAIKEYLVFIKDHQDSDKYCVSLYKLGLAYENLNRMKNRDHVWNTLSERCPDSQEAKAAKAALAK